MLSFDHSPIILHGVGIRRGRRLLDLKICGPCYHDNNGPCLDKVSLGYYHMCNLGWWMWGDFFGDPSIRVQKEG